MPYEVCISEGGREARLPALEEVEADWLAKKIQSILPDHLIEIAHDGIREVLATPKPAAKDPLLQHCAVETKSIPQHFANCCIIVVGNNHCWGKAPTLEEALKFAGKPKAYIAFIATNDTTVSEFDGALQWKTGFAPREIARKGVPRKEDTKDDSQGRHSNLRP